MNAAIDIVAAIANTQLYIPAKCIEIQQVIKIAD